MKVLVTGGAGYIGSHCVLDLLKDNKEVVILDNFSNSSPICIERISSISKKGHLISLEEGDVSDKSFVKKVFEKHSDIDSVIHFAAFKAVGESVEKPLDYYKNNVGGLISLLQNMIDFNVFKFIFSSSCTVYGEPQKVPLDEKHPTGKTFSPYGNTKYVCEQIIQSLSQSNSNFKFCILRYFNPIGADKSGLIGEDPKGIPDNLLPFICKVAVGSLDCLKIFGGDYPTEDGTAIRDYIHVSDLADAHIKSVAFLDKNEENLICNLGTGNGYSVLEVLKTFEDVSGLKICHTIEPRRSGDITKAWADPSFAEKKLGWKAKLNLKEMLSDSWNWQTKNPKGYS